MEVAEPDRRQLDESFWTQATLDQKEIGAGSYSRVDLYRYQGKAYAVKVQKADKEDRPGSTGGCLREIDIMKRLSDIPEIISIQGLRRDTSGGISTIMPCLEGTLNSLSSKLTLSSRVRMLPQLLRSMLRALAAMYQVGFDHMDVKPQNILYYRENQSDYRFRLIDFGISRSHLSNMKVNKDTAITLFYRPPEMLVADTSIIVRPGASDTWSLAAVCLEFLTKITIFWGSYQNNIGVLTRIWELINKPYDWCQFRDMIKGGKYKESFPLKNILMNEISSVNLDEVEIDTEILSVLENMLHFDPQKRLTAVDALISLGESIPIPSFLTNFPPNWKDRGYSRVDIEIIAKISQMWKPSSIIMIMAIELLTRAWPRLRAGKQAGIVGAICFRIAAPVIDCLIITLEDINRAASRIGYVFNSQIMSLIEGEILEALDYYLIHPGIKLTSLRFHTIMVELLNSTENGSGTVGLAAQGRSYLTQLPEEYYLKPLDEWFHQPNPGFVPIPKENLSKS